jgi:hypothetical protein
LDDPKLIASAQLQQGKRLERDPWHDPIAEYLSDPQRKFVTSRELLQGAIEMKLTSTSKAHSNRVGAIMRTLGGWHYGEADDRCRGWVRTDV